ncbi:glycosyltransferase family 39 protein [Peristeroidobacter agariperforans]|uniref:glycosyltransferase family 39 protein n=1 Tax=Peristeroidobacter agariperforans TaxID=268404 RepID=UPI00101D5237|nr:glycosyltransferase family 39 protein [Peristeroidobacter agariperforans]
MRSAPSSQTETSAAEVSWLTAWLPALPALAVIVLWWPSISGSFQFDDWNVIVNEPRVHSLAAWWQSMPGIRPLLKLSYALNFSLDPRPAGFRVVNILIHALSATLLGSLLRGRGLRAGLSEANASQAALFAALLFALHPVQTEAVTYISGRSSSLAACFCLLSLYCWVRSEDRERSSAWLLACCVCFGLAVATKETALILPLALLLYSSDRPVSQTLQRLTPLFLLMAAMLVVALSLPTYRRLLAVSLDTRTIGENLLTQSHAIFYLAGQLVRITNVNADPQLPVVDALNWNAALSVFALATTVVWALLNCRRRPLASFAVLWFMLWLAPTNSLLPRLDVANDRQLYQALIGPAWWLAVRLFAWQPDRAMLRPVAVALILVALSWTTYQRNLVYETEIAFWEDTAARNPASSRAANNLGMAYAIECRFGDAESAFERAVALSGDDYYSRINLILLRKGLLPGVDSKRCPHAVLN